MLKQHTKDVVFLHHQMNVAAFIKTRKQLTYEKIDEDLRFHDSLVQQLSHLKDVKRAK